MLAWKSVAKIENYTFQDFLDTARVRVREAVSLVDCSSKRCDGAVTCGLLAVECALKCLLLYGNQAPRITELGDNEQRAFSSKLGHNIGWLWNLLPAGIKNSATDEVNDAIGRLHQLDRYDHRYGKQRPRKKHAQPYVESAQIVVRWMERMTQ